MDFLGYVLAFRGAQPSTVNKALVTEDSGSAAQDQLQHHFILPLLDVEGTTTTLNEATEKISVGLTGSEAFRGDGVETARDFPTHLGIRSLGLDAVAASTRGRSLCERDHSPTGQNFSRDAK